MAKKGQTAAFINRLTSSTIYTDLKNLAISIVVWENLPDGIESEFIEDLLYTYGRAIFVKDPLMNHLCLQANPAGGVNVYNKHNYFYAVGVGYNKKYSVIPEDKEAVLIKNNALMTNTHDLILMYANKLYEIERSCDVNVKAQKTPVLITVDDKDKLSWENIYDQVDGNRPVIYYGKNLNIGAAEVLNTVAPIVFDKLSDYENALYNRLLTRLGINNANVDKKERAITDEVNANNELIKLQGQILLEQRQKAAKAINELFDLNITVKLREVEEDEPVHVEPGGIEGE
jgi:hypothetical protein